LDNYLFKKNQEKADNQLLLIEDRKLKIRKDLHMMYFLYLNRIRSEFFNYIRKAISSIEESKTTINLSKKEMQSIIANDINPLINEMMPFITIEQLTLTKYSFQNKSLKADHFPEKDLDLDVKSFYKKDNMTYLLNISSECKYYSFSEESELNSSINLDNFNFDYQNLIDYGNIDDKQTYDSVNNEKIIDGTLSDFDILKNDQENYKNMQIFYEISNLLNWSEWLDFSLSCQLRKITYQMNNILFLKKIIKNKISSEFLDYISDNNFLIANPFPFVNLFDLNNKECINFDNFDKNSDYSKIYFLNLNITEIEFFDINLNIIRNKITDLKYQMHLLIKKEKYWNNKKLYAKRNKSIINKI
tara:strand:+ start:374 stop:1450 length:1077 start_codon:yes stop_codon:yes gene_type:complete